MRISDWSSDVCSSDLHANTLFQAAAVLLLPDVHGRLSPADTNDGAGASISSVALHSAQAVFDSQPLSNPDSVKISGQALLLPLRAPPKVRGILVIMTDPTRRLLLPEQQRLLQTCARSEERRGGKECVSPV